MTFSALRERLRQHAHDLVNGGTNATDLRNDLNAAAALLTSWETQQAALRALVDKLDAVHADPRYEAVWVSYHVHGGRYDEPKYDVELAAAKAALLSPGVQPSEGATTKDTDTRVDRP